MNTKLIALHGILLLFCSSVFSQQNPKEAMEKAMQNLTPQQREQMQKMMGSLPATMGQGEVPARYPEFTSNKDLLFKRDVAKISAIAKRKLTEADISAYAGNLYNKIMARGDAGEVALVKRITTQVTAAGDLGNAAVVSMMQGHPQAAMALSMKAVQAEPSNPNWQNNMASLLTQYGYPEQAIPVLQKLRNEFTDNSTVLNNLAQAWFGLGETDSAYKLALSASGINPRHPDAPLLAGIIEEAKGNTGAALKHYSQAMENSPNAFVEKVVNNSPAKNALNNLNFSMEFIDYEKLKENLTIYIYFPKDWIRIPELSDNVSGYEEDRATRNGYLQMSSEFGDKLQKAITLSNAELKKSANPGDLLVDALKYGTSFISTPARIINTMIIMKMQKISQEYQAEEKKLLDYVKEKRQQNNRAGSQDNCAAADKRNNEFLAEVNPKIRKLYSKYIEEYRVWLNAGCTWTWYLTGNIKNTSMTLCLKNTQFFKDMCIRAVEKQELAAPCGKEGLDDRTDHVPMPDIPNFFCPTVVSVPLGLDWFMLDMALGSFDGNGFDIRRAAGVPIPNTNITIGAGGNSIAQPGISPFTQASNGSILPEYGGDQVKEYAEPETEKDLAPITTQSMKELQAAEEKRFSELLRKSQQKLLQKMMVSDCAELTTLKESEKKKAWEEKKRKAEEELKKDEEFKRIQRETEERVKWIQDRIADKIKMRNEEKQRETEERIKAFQKYIADKIELRKAERISKTLSESSLSSSPQAPGTFTPQKNLFQ